MTPNIVLIGFMGSGKSTLARELGKLSSRFVLDSDELIQKRVGMSVRAYFAQHGERAFREREREFISWVESSVRGAIISTGGGMPIFHGVKGMGVVVFLDIGFEQICARLSKQALAKRPLFANKAAARELFTQRHDLYRAQADITLNATLEAKELARELISRI